MNKPFVIAGPCLAESFSMLDESAALLSELSQKLKFKLYFKASYRKANRTSVSSFEGVGDEIALGWIKEIGQKYNLETITDIHESKDAAFVAEFVDVLQIPAFLARQTALLIAAGETGKIVNIKKAQFMAPADVIKAADKVKSTGNNNIWLTERGTFFGYNNLVVDYRGLVQMRQSGYPTVFDATHSVQQPSIGEQSGGSPEFIPALARAAAAVGIDGLFLETHPDPANAKSDAATQLPLGKVENFLTEIFRIHEIVNP
jgi:2-dehydro-3-deoxyphosphooctonate aldolase (KDO 8-P synthase)